MTSLSIKWRLSLAATAIAVLLIAAISAVGLALLRGDLADSIAEGQFALVTQVARDLDTKLAGDLEALARSASAIPDAAVHDADAFRDHFARRPEMFTVFDSFALIKPDGVSLTSYPQIAGQVQKDYSERQYFKDVMRTGKPVISEPLMSRNNPQPIVVMAAPVRDAAGEIRGVLVAVLYLRQPNLLGNLATAKVGRTGYFFLVTRSLPARYVVHPDHSRILQERPANGTPSTTRALEGFEGSIEDTNSTGVRAVFSYIGLRTTGWVLASVLPTDEAFAALRVAGQRAVLIGLLVALVVGPLVWFLAWRVLTPLSRLSTAVGKTLQDADGWTEVTVERADEVGTLARSFNALMASLKVTEADLRRSEQWLRSVTDSLPALVCYIGPDHRFLFNNRTYEQWLQKPLSEITGKPVRDVYGEAVYDQLSPSLVAALGGKPTKFEVEFPGRDGTRRCARGRYVPHFDEQGVVTGVFGLVTDETRLKEAERRLVESEKRLLDITNNIPAVIGQFDMQERCVFANDIGLKVHGIERSDLSTLTFGSHIDAQLYEQHATALRDVLACGKTSIVQGERVLDGRNVWFEAHLIPDFGPDGAQRGFYVMTFDISAIKLAEIAKARSEQRLRDITDNVPVLISHADADERLTYANETFRSWTAGTTASVVGMKLSDVLGPELYLQRKTHIERCLHGERVSYELTSQFKGVVRHLQTTYVPDFHDGKVVGMTALSVDVTVLKTAERRLERLAHRDTLTGLPNRLEFTEYLDEAFATNPEIGGSLALMFLDVDHFKRINDSYGHAVGDLVLQEFAGRVRESVRSTDFCARLGGDEFVVILSSMVTQHQARDVAAKVVQQIGRPFTVEGRSLDVTVSVGVAFGLGTRNATELLARADDALYRAKEEGRNRFCMAA